MLRNAEVEYLQWAQTAGDRPARISLLRSGLVRSLESLALDPREILTAPEPAGGDPAVIHLLAERYRVPEDEVLPVLGTSLGLFLVCAATLAPGDAVLVEAPAYEPFRKVPESLGARVVPFDRRALADWSVDPEAILRSWNPAVRLVIVSDLHNPTGRRAGDEALSALAAAVERRGARLLVDEVYRDFRDGPVGTSRWGADTVVVSSLTKVYGLGGLRAGWVLGPAPLVRRLRAMLNVLHVVDPAPLPPLVRAALGRADELRHGALEEAQAGRRIYESWCDEHPEVGAIRPHGGITAWVPVGAGRTGSEVATRLLRDHGVAVVPGRYFGDDSGVRVGFSGDPEEVREGLQALAGVLAAR